ncbi:hypothetical protein LCI18_009671 [Fusarium solani-melongenae]|uniref:Uncharacterized protein n=1 Tax=Fusarium solani subsp. cucurbitae TaxID=2747967 RepID=A0ACD3ZD20_FUSSC|nr:hypothetical protein LCI18_009671 [Fusarium solani-melongenae]
MVEQQYIAPGLPHSDGLSGAPNLHDAVPTTAALPASPYPDLTPYASVSSSFNSIPGQCDSSLLTPISVAGSPPLHQVSKIAHQQYPPPPTTPNQQPTPPGSSKMYHQQWPGQFDVNGQSPQTSSPMTSQPPVTQEFLDPSYVHEGRRTPGPPEPYMGNFGVSTGPEPQTMNQPYYLSVAAPVDHQNQMMMRESQHMPMGMHHREMPHAPLLHEPHPSQFRQQRRPSMEDQALHGLPADVPRSVTGSPRRRVLQAPNRVKKRQSKRSGAARNVVAEDPLDEHKNCFGQEVPPTLKSSCPEEERCIFESRWQHRHQKGQDMWESIQNDFKDRFHKCPGKEMLQMKFKRGRSKYIDWINKDEELLREAWMRVEKNRYQMILESFIELGGSRNMRLSASDIEVKVVNDLKLEEGLYMESHGDANIRRRRKSLSTRKRSGARGVDDSDVPTNDEMMSVGSHNTHEDEVINQVHGPFKLDDEASANPNNMMEMHLWDQQIKMEPGVMQQRNDRMQPMMRMSPGSQTMYGGRRGS